MDPSSDKIMHVYTFFGRTENDLLRDLVVFMKIYAPKTYKYLLEKNKTLKSHMLLENMIFAHRKFFICSQYFLWNGKDIRHKRKV